MTLCDKLDHHLDDCSPCKAYLASLEETVRRCRRQCTEEVKAGVRAQVRQLLRKARQTATAPGRPFACH